MNPRRSIAILGAWLLLISAGYAIDQADLARRIDQLVEVGRFQQAKGLLDRTLNNSNLQEGERRAVLFEIDRLDRITKDYPFTERELFQELSKAVRDLTWSEYQGWIREGRFDSRDIEGTRKFMATSVSNLFFRHPELNPRRMPRRNTAPHDAAVLRTCLEIERAAEQQHSPYVLPKKFDATMTLTVKPGVVPSGEMVRAWLPVPRQYPFQGGFHLVSSSGEVKSVDPESAPIRAVCLEQPSRGKKPTTFKIRYEYTNCGVRFELDPQKASENAVPAELAEFLKEELHVVFTPEMRALSKKVVGDETNAVRKARKIYDWISENIKYSFAIEYSTIRNIGEYCRSHGYGDCGQEALLFITLCRLNGIPARWQSGWNTFPDAKTIHDWTEIYIAPYGWVPVDPYMGIFAMRYATSLRPEQREKIRSFYFGGLDQYRMAANSDHSQALSVPKRSMRSDDVDFQRGELEWGDHNIYFDQFDYDLAIREMKLPQNPVNP